MVKSSAYEAMLLSGTGQSDTKWLIRDGKVTEPCGTPACTWRCAARWPLYRQVAFLPRKYATSHLTKLLIITRNSRWLTVSKAFEMSTATATLLLGCFRRLKPSAIFAATKRTAETREWCGLKPCCEGLVPKDDVSSGRTSRSRILTAGHSAEINL